MMGQWRQLGAACAVVLVMAGACNQDEETTSEPTTELQLRYDIEITGAVTAKGRAEAPSMLARQAMAGAVTGPSLGLQPFAPMPLGEGKVLVGALVTPYKGDGDYVIPPGSPLGVDLATGAPTTTPDGKKPVDPGSASLQWSPPGSDTPTLFTERLEPCTVTIDDDGRKGRVHCPKLAESSVGSVVDLSFRWEPAGS